MSTVGLTRTLFVLVGATFGATTAVEALEMHPPWVYCPHTKEKSPYFPPWVGCDHVKDKSPYYPPWVGHSCDSVKSPAYPPWIGTKCHQLEAPRDGFWAYPVNWRDVDWSQAKFGGIHQRTQAFSLWLENKKNDDAPPPRMDILEYFRDPPLTGPGRVKY
ncbi:hypothetical protein GC163_18735 [bacterium]|nr:hypothetical protein [bacterium]